MKFSKCSISAMKNANYTNSTAFERVRHIFEEAYMIFWGKINTAILHNLKNGVVDLLGWDISKILKNQTLLWPNLNSVDQNLCEMIILFNISHVYL